MHSWLVSWAAVSSIENHRFKTRRFKMTQIQTLLIKLQRFIETPILKPFIGSSSQPMYLCSFTKPKVALAQVKVYCFSSREKH